MKFSFTSILIFGMIMLCFEKSYAQANSQLLVKIHEHTTSEIASLVNLEKGMLVFNTDSLNLFFYDGTSWQPTKSAKLESVSYNNTSGELIITENGEAYSTHIDKKVPISLSGTSLTWDYTLGYNTSTTLGANTSLTISNTPAGSYGTIVVTQDATGGHDLNVPANSKVGCGGTGVLNISKDPNAISIVSFYFDGTTYFWTCSQNFN